jgi:hypothetical protein
MKYLKPHRPGEVPVVELTRRNLVALLEKLDDPKSARTLVDRTDRIAVRAVEDVEHYADRAPGEVYMPSSGRRY